MYKVKIATDEIKGSSCGLYVCPGINKSHAIRIEKRWEIIYVVEGTLSMHEEHERKFELTKGNVLLLRPHKVHGSTKCYSKDLKFYWLHFFAKDAEVDKTDNFEEFAQMLQPAMPERLENLLQMYHEELLLYNDDPYYEELLIRLILKELTFNKNEFANSPSELAVKIHMYIHTHFSNPLKTSIIAKEFGYNSDYLERKFKEFYNTTITNEIKKARIANATHLLLHTTLNISEIAQNSGFSSKEDFCRAFKSKTSLSPIKYRKTKGIKIYRTD
jgi:YesN/AraC family two-component response regulator